MHNTKKTVETVNEKYWQNTHLKVTSFFNSIWDWDKRQHFLPTARKHFPDLVKTTHSIRETLETSANDFDFEELKVTCELYEKLIEKLILRSNFRYRRIA